MNLQDFINDYLAWSRGVHRPNTVTSNSLALRRFKDHVGDVAIETIGPRHADQFLSACRASGLKATSVNNYYRHLKAAFQKAVAWELVPANPFAKVKPVRADKVQPKFIPKEKLGEFLSSIEDDDARLLLTAYCATGRRRVELLSLTWDDIDMEGRKYMVRSTKAHLTKDFPINDIFYSVLAQLDIRRKACSSGILDSPESGSRSAGESSPSYSPSGSGRSSGSGGCSYVFGKWKPDTVTHIVKRELRRAGYGDMHLHHLRHSFASAYLMNGGDLYALKELLGHSQINTTLIYSHLTKNHLEGEANKVRF